MTFLSDLLREIRINLYEWRMYRAPHGKKRMYWWWKMRDEINKRSRMQIEKIEKRKGLV